MTSSLKIGIISGLFAGFVKAFVSIFISVPLIFRLELPYYFIPPPPETPFTNIIIMEIIYHLILGFIFGIIFSKAYRVIPKKGVLKGFVFGLFGYLVCNLYWVALFLPYGQLDIAATMVIYGLIGWIPFGIVLGFVYEFLHNRYHIPKKEPKIIQYNMIGGFYPGAIAGILGGVATFIANFTITYDFAEFYAPGHTIDFGFLIGQLSGQIMFHMIWGIFFGLIYPKVYNLVPFKGILKGLCYGLIAQFLIAEFPILVMNWGYGNFITVHMQLALGGSNAIVYGIVLGLLYRKPTK
jgi:hypothetical protein